MTYKSITLLLFFTSTLFFGQKKTITHNDYDLWKEITDIKISDKGKLVVSTVETSTKRGDGYVEIFNTQTNQKTTFFNGYDTSISFDERYVVFKRRPEYQKLRKEKKKKIKKENQSKDALFIYDVYNDDIYDSIPRVTKYKLPKKSNGWMVIEKFKNKKDKDFSDTKKKDTFNQNVSSSFKQKYGLVYNFKTKERDTILKIKNFVIPEKGNTFYYSTTSKEKKEKEAKKAKKGSKAKERDLGVYSYNLELKSKKVIDTGKYLYEGLSISKLANHFAFLTVRDSTASDSLEYELYHYHNNVLKKPIESSGNDLKNDWKLSGGQTPYFSENEKRLYFYSKPKMQYQRDTTLLEEEIPQVDVWHWQDKLIQPEQKSKFKELASKAFLSYYDIEKKSFIHLQDEQIDDLIFDKNREQKFILGANQDPYDIQRSWSSPWTRDFYVINTITGEKRMALKNTALAPILSTDGRYALYFDIYKQHWFSINLSTLNKINLTKDIDVPLYNEDDDRPKLPYPYGFGGFDSNGYALVYDKFDIWRIALDGKEKPKNITKNGRANKIEYRTEKLDPENENKASYINNTLLITSFDKSKRISGLYALKKNKLIEKIVPSEFLIKKYKKAENAEVFVYSKENFNTFPDIYISRDGFKNHKRITNVNPHQKNFKWGSAKLFSWKAFDGEELEGIIYKPENFDPAKKYPLITYFYEKRSDTYHKYYAPQPSASTVNPVYLVSNEYVMFVPDIVYKEGKPGPSAYNCVVSGIEALEKLGYIDSNNIAIQGQSWGGYQVAYLITVTNKFKAAMAGAPVSNMTSAYGGIRWKTGLSRAFQYERTQSRIGKNLWDGFDLYVENSPLFGIPKIETPLLMMHNDNDGAVPYYQGIEMFMGMRRLQKPVWLLVYNDEEHNLKKVKNKQDLSIRMMQFFDHYLKNRPAPGWMIKGVPRTQKGKDFGYGTN
ncbi:prolyl oligopeptidase family serine peptidase [Aquimarina gracilis]|uniref:Prolyl oligopeptidase family serine peptidase n=1 Tax=Aquimarina gracilis TaxID=874422 RepID=A0ABU5ZXG0_9FLAO|nr:prolyl oligopeptidase family serine peptidase [Aquimarina gracilis]MEB3346569.1 prolyl oligopeptidase family serine peptidase [Aquimarina gracilis]